MSNRRKVKPLSVTQTRKPVPECNADELHRELVADMVRNVHTPLVRFIEAVARIAELRKISQERAYQEIRTESMALGQRGGMFG